MVDFGPVNRDLQSDVRLIFALSGLAVGRRPAEFVFLNGYSLSTALRPLLDPCIYPHLLCCYAWASLPSEQRSRCISRGARLSNAPFTSPLDSLKMACSSDTWGPIAGQSENPSPSPKTNSQSSQTDSQNKTIVLCFDGTGNQFCEKVRRYAVPAVA